MRQDRGEDALARLNRLVAEDLNACNRLIIDRMHSPVALIPQLAAHIVAVFGVYHHWSHTEALSHTARRTAELTGWSVPLVKVRAFRARAEMKKCLQRIARDKYL